MPRRAPIVSLDMKGRICHFVKWQIHPLISKGTQYHPYTLNSLVYFVKSRAENGCQWNNLIRIFILPEALCSHPSVRLFVCSFSCPSVCVNLILHRIYLSLTPSSNLSNCFRYIYYCRNIFCIVYFHILCRTKTKMNKFIKLKL